MKTERVSLITLGVADLAAARGFYARLGWREAQGTDSVVFFQMQGQALALYAKEDLARDQGRDVATLGTGAVTLAQNFDNRAGVDAAFAAALAAGGWAVKVPEAVFWGGYAGTWADPDGHVWELAHNPFWPLLPDGKLVLPGTTEVIHETQMSRADEAEIAALLMLAFDNTFAGRSFYRTRHHIRLVIRENGQIIAHLAIQFRAMRLGGRLVDIAALAEVCSHPGHRGRGLASRLLHDAINEAKRARASHMMLFGTAALYGAAGFNPAENCLTYLDLEGAKTGEVMCHTSETLQVLDLADRPWDGAADLDMLGGLF